MLPVTQLFYDRATLSDDSRIGSDGVFRTTARFGRVGVQNYYDASGNLVRRFRPPEEVKKAAKTFDMAVVTKDHPKEDGRMVSVTAENRDKFQIGMASSTEYRDGWLHGVIAITEEEGIKAAQTTHRELSDGYSAELVPVQGIFVDAQGLVGKPGMAYAYDEKMTNITGNHRAIVPKARAGSMAVMDSVDVADVGPGTGQPCGAGYISSAKNCRIGGGSGGGAPDFGDKVPSFKDFTNKWTEYIESADEGIPDGLSDEEFDRAFEEATKIRQEELVSTVPETFGGEKEEVRGLDYDEAVAAAYVHIYPEAADDFFALGEEEQHRLLSNDSLEDPMTDKKYEIVIGDLKQEVTKDFYLSWIADKKNKERLVVDSAQPTFDPKAIALEFDKRHTAFNDALEYLPEGTEFDGSKTAEDWLSMALSSRGVDVSKIRDVESAFVGLRLNTREEPSPVHQFAWQVADSQQQAAFVDRSRAKQRTGPTAYEELADAQAQELEYQNGAFDLAKQTFMKQHGAA